MKPHKHAEVIKAWADGHEIQYRMQGTARTEWIDSDTPTWNETKEYRVKPTAPTMHPRFGWLDNSEHVRLLPVEMTDQARREDYTRLTQFDCGIEVKE